MHRRLLQGKMLQLAVNQTVYFGRDSRCQINYPAGSKGISRQQCQLMSDQQGRLGLRDVSSYGTYINGVRIQPGIWYLLKKGDTFSFAAEKYQVYG